MSKRDNYDLREDDGLTQIDENSKEYFDHRFHGGSDEDFLEKFRGIDSTSVEKAIVAKGKGITGIGKYIQLSSIGAVFDREIGLDEFTQFFEVLKRIQSSMQWIVGDWANHGELAMDMTYDEMAEVTGYKVKTLQNFAYVSRHVPISLRKEVLSFGHHNLVAGFTKEDQEKFLNYAEINNLSVRELQAIIDNTPALPGEDHTGFKRFGKNSRFLGKIATKIDQNRKIRAKDVEESIDRIREMRLWLDDVERALIDREG